MSSLPQPVNQPKLADLMARHLQRQADARAAGLGPVELGEVVPFDASPVQAVEPQVAWQAALEPLRVATLAPPPDWSALVAQQEPIAALAYAAGNFPQLVRHLQPLLHGGQRSELRPQGGRPLALPGLSDWAEEADPALAVGVLRLARHFDAVRKLLRKVPAEQRINEEAALAWHEGQADDALRLWESLPAGLPAHFNRGMALLFLDRSAEARPLLAQAVAQLPESSSWHHLARLYLTMAEMR